MSDKWWAGGLGDSVPGPTCARRLPDILSRHTSEGRNHVLTPRKTGTNPSAGPEGRITEFIRMSSQF